MAEDKLPPGVTLDEALPPGVTLDRPGGVSPDVQRASDEFLAAAMPGINLKDRLKTAIMPMIGTVAGQVAGSPFGRRGEMVGEGIGSGVGTVANMAAGLQRPSLSDLGASLVTPLFGRAVGGLMKPTAGAVAKQLPGYAAAGHELASTQVRGIPDLIRPGTPSGTLYEQLRNMPDVVVDTTHLRRTAQTLIDADIRASKIGMPSPPTREIAEGVLKATSPTTVTTPSRLVNAQGQPMPTTSTVVSPGPVSFNEYWDGVKRIGKKIEAYQTSGGEALGASKLLYKAAMQDLEVAANRYPLLKSANEAYKKEKAAEAVHEVITNRVITPTSNGLIQIQPQIMRKWLTNTENADTVKNISPQEMAGINRILNVAERLPRLPPPQGQQYGSGSKIVTGAYGSLFGGGAGALGGMLSGTGAGPGAAIGAAISTPAFIAANSLVSKAMQSDWGRRQLMKVMDRGPFLDHAAVAALAVAINSGSKASGSDTGKVRLGPNPLEP